MEEKGLCLHPVHGSKQRRLVESVEYTLNSLISKQKSVDHPITHINK